MSHTPIFRRSLSVSSFLSLRQEVCLRPRQWHTTDFRMKKITSVTSRKSIFTRKKQSIFQRLLRYNQLLRFQCSKFIIESLNSTLLLKTQTILPAFQGQRMSNWLKSTVSLNGCLCNTPYHLKWFYENIKCHLIFISLYTYFVHTMSEWLNFKIMQMDMSISALRSQRIISFAGIMRTFWLGTSTFFQAIKSYDSNELRS